MVLDEPRNKFGVSAREAVLEAESERVDLSERRVVAAAAFGNVVKQTGEIKQLRLLEVIHQAAAQWKFVGELGHREAAQITQYIQDVLVDGIDVIQIVLHLAHDATERRNIAAEHAVLVHAP